MGRASSLGCGESWGCRDKSQESEVAPLSPSQSLQCCGKWFGVENRIDPLQDIGRYLHEMVTILESISSTTDGGNTDTKVQWATAVRLVFYSADCCPGRMTTPAISNSTPGYTLPNQSLRSPLSRECPRQGHECTSSPFRPVHGRSGDISSAQRRGRFAIPQERQTRLAAGHRFVRFG